jgi:vacuolar-type H+-ATPase subunit H
MSTDIDTLKVIRQKEMEAQERVKKASDDAKKIVNDAVERKKEILKEAEAVARRNYEEKVKEEMNSANLEAKEIERRFEEQIEKLKRKISKEVLDKIMETILE